MRNYIVIYTDGSCNRKNRLGGFGVYIEFYCGRHDDSGNQLPVTKRFCKGYSDTTISRMELRAIIEALRLIKKKDKYEVFIISDSEYTINSINKGWLESWERDKFSNRLNQDLWKEFLVEKRKFPARLLRFIHTRGHEQGEKRYQRGNSIADELADYKQFTERERDNMCPVRATEWLNYCYEKERNNFRVRQL